MTIEGLYYNQGEDTTYMCAKNPAMDNIWQNPCIFYFIQTLELIFDSGKSFREVFYRWITNDHSQKATNMDPMKHSFLSLFVKLNSDLLFFLTSKPTVNNIWWFASKLYIILPIIVVVIMV